MKELDMNKPMNEKQMFKAVMRAKSEIDTIRELNNLGQNHKLSRASDILEDYLNQAKRKDIAGICSECGGSCESGHTLHLACVPF